MKRERLANIQWQFIRNSISVSLLTGVLIVFLLTYGEKEGFAVLFRKSVFGVPLFLVLPSVCLIIGAVIGRLVSQGVKKRLDVLEQGTMALEKGNLSHRLPHLGNDEIGHMAIQLNTMAARIEEQVASLQKLSSERAEWQDAVKEAAVNEERQRLARDLHDAVSQQLFAISMMTAAVPRGLEANLEKGKKQIELIGQMAATAQSEMRALLLHLRPAHLEGKNLEEGIETLLLEMNGKHGLDITWKIGPLPPISKGVEDHLFRIVQEALSNTLRHAKADKIDVQLRVVSDQIRLKVIDNGIGFEQNETKASSYGLKTMKERVNEIGGVLELISIPNKGTQVNVKVPLLD
ncbi:MAG TPA: sensor histidine kinase [Bacilli bacterium]|nr:sensor histidine kinase [Bacilli bacterium]